MRTHIESDPWGWRQRLLALAIIVGMIALIVTAGAAHVDAAPARPAGWTCSTDSGQACACRIVFERVGVKWQRAILCSPLSQSRIDGLAAPAPAPAAGNLGGCALSNRVRRLTCNVTDFLPGRVSGTCVAGMHFDDVPTVRTFHPGQIVYVQACVGMDGELFSAANWPLRISR